MGKEWKETRMDGKVVVVTGGNSGLGLESCKVLVARGAKVYMLGRNEERLAAAQQEVMQAINVTADVIPTRVCDLGSLQSIRDFAADFKKNEQKLDVLMNNAGNISEQAKTVDGFELQFGVNVLGHFLLTHLLTDQLIAAAPGSRVVNIASVGHKLGKGDIQWDDIMFEKNYDPYECHYHTKLGNILFNVELSKRLKDSGVTCYSLHPGSVQTRLVGKAVGVGGCMGCLMRCLNPCFSKVEDGALTQLKCAMDPALSEETGFYYANMKKATPSRAARNEESAARLWDVCLDLIQMKPEEIPEALKKN